MVLDYDDRYLRAAEGSCTSTDADDRNETGSRKEIERGKYIYLSAGKKRVAKEVDNRMLRLCHREGRYMRSHCTELLTWLTDK